MANVAKLMDIIYGSNPSDDDLRAIVARISERLPKPVVEAAPEPEPVDVPDEPTEQVSQSKTRKGK